MDTLGWKREKREDVEGKNQTEKNQRKKIGLVEGGGYGRRGHSEKSLSDVHAELVSLREDYIHGETHGHRYTRS